VAEEGERPGVDPFDSDGDGEGHEEEAGGAPAAARSDGSGGRAREEPLTERPPLGGPSFGGVSADEAVWAAKNPFEGPLPEDIERVWGQGKLDGSGMPAAETARILIQAWGLETFRTSAIHRQAVLELERDGKMETVRKGFVDAKGKK
jgi:hypothetical protein